VAGRGGTLDGRRARWAIEGLIDIFVLTLLVVTALAVGWLRNLLAAVMITGIYSLLSACWMLALDAPDVAYTEAAVGAGISTVLMLATLRLTAQEERQPVGVAPVPLFIALVTGMVLVYGTLDMPRFGDPGAPIHHHVAPYYLEQTAHDIEVPNVITAVLASYRGYDTLGETSVVFTAVVGVWLLLRRRERPEAVA
jgi:multicomponent Na+:H+ antiporter subunit B